MLDTQESTRDLVVPKWSDFDGARKSNELIYPRRSNFEFKELNDFTKHNLEKDYIQFLDNPNLQDANDLMGSAFVVGSTLIAEKMAKHVLMHQDSKITAKNFAKRILNISNFDNRYIKIEEEIKNRKLNLIKYPKNAIGWAEIARLYTIKGQFNKAKKAILVGLGLAPTSRYVVRASVRFFMHIGDLDAAWYFIRKATTKVKDPWLIAPEISVSIRADKNIRNLKNLIPSSLSPNNIFHFSELIESYGMLECLHGNVKNAKKNFKIAWSNPSQNVVTHGEWVLRNKFPHLYEQEELDFSNSLEATAWRHYHNLRLEEAAQFAKEWELDEPYSRQPYILSSSILCDLDRTQEAVETASRGLLSNPNDFMIRNNLCYAFLSNGQVDQAESLFKNIGRREDSHEKIFYSAINGFLEFKKGNIPAGRKHYTESIELSRAAKDQLLVEKATLHLALAELSSRTKESREIALKALEISKKTKQPESLIKRGLVEKKLDNLNI